jgi:hypothetical protein
LLHSLLITPLSQANLPSFTSTPLLPKIERYVTAKPSTSLQLPSRDGARTLHKSDEHTSTHTSRYISHAFPDIPPNPAGTKSPSSTTSQISIAYSTHQCSGSLTQSADRPILRTWFHRSTTPTYIRWSPDIPHPRYQAQRHPNLGRHGSVKGLCISTVITDFEKSQRSGLLPLTHPVRLSFPPRRQGTSWDSLGLGMRSVPTASASSTP